MMMRGDTSTVECSRSGEQVFFNLDIILSLLREAEANAQLSSLRYSRYKSFCAHAHKTIYLGSERKRIEGSFTSSLFRTF